METKKFQGTPTPIQIKEALVGIEDETDFVERAAEEERLSVEEYEKKHGKREITLGDIGVPKNVQEKYKSLTRWVFDIMPAEFKNSQDVVRIFQEEAKEQSFQDIWNWKIFIPAGLTEKVLINSAAKKILYLEDLSRINLNSSEISESRNLSEEKDKIERLIKNLKEIPKEIDALSYLIQKIVIEKLEEILRILNRETI